MTTEPKHVFDYTEWDTGVSKCCHPSHVAGYSATCWEASANRAGWVSPEEAAAREAAARREALLEAADEMDNTDDPDAIYVDNGDIDLWLRARAERIQGIEADAYIAAERDEEGGND